jgi:hypothetical protein
MSHGTEFSILSTPCVCAVLLEQLKSPAIIQPLQNKKLFENIWPRPTNKAILGDEKLLFRERTSVASKFIAGLATCIYINC